MKRTLHFHSGLALTALGLLGCDPDPTNLGENDPSDAWEVEWRADSKLETAFLGLSTMPDGGALVVEADFAQERTILRRYDVHGTESVLFSESGPKSTSVAVSADAVFVGREVHETGMGGSRAGVLRLSHDGAHEGVYLHPRATPANSFSMGLAVAQTELAVVIGNWGDLAPGESWFEVQRLDHQLEAIGEPLAFDHSIDAVAYDADDDLVILEVPHDGPSIVHRPTADVEPVEVHCSTLLVEGGQPLCAWTWPPFEVTNYETGEVQPLELGFDVVQASAGSSLVFASTGGSGVPLSIAEVLPGGIPGRSTTIPLAPDALGFGMLGLQQTPDGAVYAAGYEAFEDSPSCLNCFRSYLVRLSAND
jgi:hypothetical protein